MSAMMLPNSVNENNLLPWQLISSRARVKKPFVAINTGGSGEWPSMLNAATPVDAAGRGDFCIKL